MRIFIGLAAAMLLAGCASVSDVRSNPPLLSLTSHKSAKVMAECIRDGWQSTSIIGGNVGGSLQSTGDRYSVVAPNAESPVHVVDVSPAKGGSTIQYHFYRTWQSPLDSVKAVVQVCAQ